MQVDITTPDGTIYHGSPLSVTLPSGAGEITVLKNHIPLISTVMPGTVVIRDENGEQVFAVSRGVVQVEHNSVRILADTADRAEELEEQAVELAKQKAEDLMDEKRNDAEGFADATAILERELARLRTVRRIRSRGRGASPSGF